VTNDFNSEPQISVSDLAQRRPIRGLKVVLEGSNSNRNAIGATVRVHAGGQVYTKYNDGKSGYLGGVLPAVLRSGRRPQNRPGGSRLDLGEEATGTSRCRKNQTLVVTEPN